MKKILALLCLSYLTVSLSCVGLSEGLKVLPDPEPDTVMVIGCVLIENIDRNLVFRYWDTPMKVVIVGKGEEGTVEHYTVNTDYGGYYCLSNVPKGVYIIKAVIFQESGEIPNIIVNDWDYYYSKFYLMKHPERGVEYTANWFPPGETGRIINQDILWFGLKLALDEDRSETFIGEVLTSIHTRDLQTERLMTDGHPYTRDEPLTHIKNKFPDSQWWE